MKAAVVHTLGQPPRYQDFAEPTPNDTEILIQVHAAGLHPIVKARASGAHYSSKGEVPVLAGIDGVGTRPDGARVYFGGARAPWGTMAERCAAPVGMCLPLPDGISYVQAAAIANPGMSAWLSLRDRAAVAPGESVLILGATGVAGQLAIQAARQLGAGRIIAAGRNVAALISESVDGVIALGEPEEAVSLRHLAKNSSPAAHDPRGWWRWARAPDRPLRCLAPCCAAWTSSCWAADSGRRRWRQF